MTNVIKCSKCEQYTSTMFVEDGEYRCWYHAKKSPYFGKQHIYEQPAIVDLQRQIEVLIEQRNVLAKAVDDVVTVFSLSYLDSPYTRTQALEIIELARRIVKEINLQETEA